MPEGCSAEHSILVAGIGNIFFSDDGFGPAVAAELTRRSMPAGVTVVDYGIRGIHLAFDLSHDVSALVLLDTVPEAAGSPGSLVVLELDQPDAPAGASGPWGPASVDGHGMHPGAVLASLTATADTWPAAVYLVGCQPATLDEGMELSPVVAAAVPAAADKVLALLDQLTTRACGPAPSAHPEPLVGGSQ